MNRKTLFAGGVFAALALIAIFVLKSPEKGTRTTDAPRPVARLVDFDTVEVTKGATTTAIKKDGSAFKITAPVPYAADQDAAKQAFEALEKLDFVGIVSDQKSKQDEYEVGANAVRVVAKKADKVLADLRIGKLTNNATMVRVEGKDEIWQAAGSLKFTFDKDAASFRDKSLVSFEESAAETLTIVSKTGGKIVLSRKPKGDAGAPSDWTVVESTVKVEPFDRTVAPSLVSSLYAWKANDFADGAKPEETGLDAPDLTVTVGLKGGSTKTILIGNKKGDDDVYVKTADSPQVFLVKKYNLERIRRRPIEFREKTICDVAEANITDLSVSRDKDPFTLTKDAKKTGPDAWKFAKPTGATLDTTKVSALLTAFKEWKASSFAEDNSAKATGLEKPSAVITARATGKGGGCLVKIGAETPDKQGYFVERSGSPDVFVAQKWSVDRFLPKLDDLKKKSGS